MKLKLRLIHFLFRRICVIGTRQEDVRKEKQELELFKIIVIKLILQRLQQKHIKTINIDTASPRELHMWCLKIKRLQ